MTDLITTDLDPVPSRSAPSTFSSRMDTLLGKLPAWTTEANTLATGANTNKLAAEAAQTAAELAETGAVTAKTNAETAETNAETARDYANKWATEAADTQVNDGVNPADYSAYHYAQTALNAPGTSAISTTSLTIGTGSKTLTIQTDKDIVVGMFVVIANTGTPTNYMGGQVTSYTSGTGELIVNVTATGGSGTIAAWTISLSALTFDAASQAEMEAGTETALRSVSPVLIKEAVAAHTPQGINLVASGTLDDGSVVVLNSDGTVSMTTTTSDSSAGDAVVFESAATSWISAAFDSANNKVVIAYQDDANLDYGTAIVGTVSGTDISFGTAVVFEEASTAYTSVAFDSTNEKVVIAYRDNSNTYGTAIVGTVSGTSISFGTAVVFEVAATSHISVAFDSTNEKVVIAYSDGGNSSFGTAIVGTVSGTDISFGTAVVFEEASTAYTSVAFDSTNEKVVIAYSDGGNSSYGTAIVGTVSGTSISFGTAVVFEVAATSHISAVFDSTNGKVVIAYTDGGNSSYGTAIVGTVSGTSISFGTAVVFEVASTSYCSAAFDSTNNKVVIAYRDNGNSSYGTAIVGTVSGTDISFGTAVVFESAATQYISAAFDSTNEKVVIAYMDGGHGNYGTAVAYSAEFTDADNWFGISSDAYTDAQVATILKQFDIATNLTGLTAGEDYYVASDGSLTTDATPYGKIGQSLSTTELLITGDNV